MRHVVSLLVLLLLTACGSHPLAGAWAQETADGKHGVTIEFEMGGSRVTGHCDVDGAHQHIDGTYACDTAQGAVTVTLDRNAALLGLEPGQELAGKVAGDRLELSADGRVLTFRRTEDVPGH